MNANYAAASEALRNATCAVALTGAGISAESGIPTFRGDSGIWEKYPPDDYATIEAYLREPEKVWRFWCELSRLVRGCLPNAGHFALAAMEAQGKLRGVITQNVDNMHQAAGSRHVIEFHGNAHRLVCMECQESQPLDISNMGDNAPRCARCATLMKPDVVMFGEDIPAKALSRARAMAEQCDVMLVIGTSARVYPAAQLPQTAKSNGATLIEVNTEVTDFTSVMTDIFVKGPAGEVLPRLASALQ
ncbi:MAG: NAD-dependent deacylase [Candidatus Hydrogenedentes bacterium]|nr:NAD-dependent deacylase [Candidatus Hydrogenedentota bacterium]